jgi:hypothetical protein
MSAASAMAGSVPPSFQSTDGSRGQSAPSGSATVPSLMSAVQEKAATLLVQLYNYLQANIQQYPALANAIPTAFDAVELYGRGLYPQALAQTLIIYQWTDSQGGVPPAPQVM